MTRKNPEGTLWREVFTSEGKGLVQLSVAPTGVVWGVTWDGQGVIRIGVSRDHPLGKEQSHFHFYFISRNMKEYNITKDTTK